MRLLLPALLLMLSLAAGAAAAGTVVVQGAWIRTTPSGALTAAGYATLVNNGAAPDRLLGGRTVVASEVTPHQMSMQGGVMRMRPIPGGLLIAAHSSVQLEPDGGHLMLLGLRRPLRAGQHVRIVLRFARAGAVPVEFVVRDGPPMPGMHM
jgi:hypothetical protein